MRKNYEVVGLITDEVANLAEFNFKGQVLMAPGVKKHIIKRHQKDLDPTVIDELQKHIHLIINQPDFVGKHPKKIGKSLELIKLIGEHLLVAIEVDIDDDYIYVASLYPITESKLENRIQNGRVKKL